MAYEFASASSQYLSASAPLTNIPATLHGLGYNESGNTGALVSLYETSASHRIQITRAEGGSIVHAAAMVTNVVGQGNTPDNSTTNQTWYAQQGLFPSVSSRTVYVNGGNGATNTTSLNASNNYTDLVIGARYSTTLGVYLNGRAAECAIWNVALTDAEIASLGKGFKPYRIRPQSLVFYAPLIRNIQDTKGGRTITNNNTATVAAHPRVI